MSDLRCLNPTTTIQFVKVMIYFNVILLCRTLGNQTQTSHINWRSTCEEKCAHTVMKEKEFNLNPRLYSGVISIKVSINSSMHAGSTVSHTVDTSIKGG